MDYDAFVSYATEDQEVASEIVGALKARGFKIWYAPYNLTIGDSLLESIDNGMKNSRAAIIVLSGSYLRKGWTNYERDYFMRSRIESEKIILPVWCNVTKEEIEDKNTGLAGIMGLQISDGFRHITNEIAKKLASHAPTIGVIPSYESPRFRFLNGEGEILIKNDDGPATTLWELLVYSPAEAFPLYLDGESYSREELLIKAAQIINIIPERVERVVYQEGLKKLNDLFEEYSINLHDYY